MYVFVYNLCVSYVLLMNFNTYILHIYIKIFCVKTSVILINCFRWPGRNSARSLLSEAEYIEEAETMTRNELASLRHYLSSLSNREVWQYVLKLREPHRLVSRPSIISFALWKSRECNFIGWNS